MVVRCANCGAELLGAVNRCWRCGTGVLSRSGEAGVPPVRRRPIDSSALNLSTVPAGEIVVAAVSDAAVGEGAAAPVVARRVGSPFAASVPTAARGEVAAVAPATAAFHATPADYPRNATSVGGAIAAVVLGIISLIASFFTAGAVVTAALGLAMGVWGLYSTRRGVAFAGLALCCLALASGGFHGIVSLYEYQHGYRPWAAPAGVNSAESSELDTP